MTVLGLTDVATKKEVDDEIKYHERRKWLRPGKDKSARQSVLIGQEKLIDYHRCISELKGLACEKNLDEESCGSITDEFLLQGLSGTEVLTTRFSHLFSLLSLNSNGPGPFEHFF